VLTQHPNIAKHSDWLLRQLRHFVLIGQARLDLLGCQSCDLIGCEASQVKVKAKITDLAKLKRQHLFVPACVHGKFVVRDDIGAFLGIAPALCNHHGNLGHLETLGCEGATVAGNDAAVLIHQDGGGPAPFLDAGRELADLFVGVCAAVASVWHQFGDVPTLNLVCGIV
jgi:hypothetical protein